MFTIFSLADWFNSVSSIFLGSIFFLFLFFVIMYHERQEMNQENWHETQHRLYDIQKSVKNRKE